MVGSKVVAETDQRPGRSLPSRDAGVAHVRIKHGERRGRMVEASAPLQIRRARCCKCLSRILPKVVARPLCHGASYFVPDHALCGDCTRGVEEISPWQSCAPSKRLRARAQRQSPKIFTFYLNTCRRCGQRFDLRYLADVIYHRVSPYQPMAPRPIQPPE